MKLDAKQKVLIAIYLEYQKDIPDYTNNVSADSLKLDQNVFEIAIDKLQGENLIQGAFLERMLNGRLCVEIPFIKMTRDGIQYVESKFGIQIAENGIEKTKLVLKKAGEWGYEQIFSFAAKVVVEAMKD